MSNTGDNAPLVPRRSLGATPQSAETVTHQGAPPYGATPDLNSASPPRNGPPPLQPAPPQPPTADGRAAPAPPQQTTVTKPPKPPKTPKPPKPPKAPKAQKAPKPPRKSRRDRKGPRTIRRAKLHLVRVDPWSVTKVSFLLAIAFGIMCVVAVFLIFSIMNAAGLWDAVNETANELYRQEDGQQFDVTEYVGMSRVMGITMLVAAVDVVLITALATLGAFIYNMGASLLGGIEVTLAEDIQ